MTFSYEHPRPAVTADVVLFGAVRGELRVLLVRRARSPFAGAFALPGGFVDIDEDLPDAARRELREETGVRVRRIVQLGAYGAVDRDPRGRTISVVFLAIGDAAAMSPQAGDDAAAAAWRPAARPGRLAFDHAKILRDARTRLARLAAAPDFGWLFCGTNVPAWVKAVRRAAVGGPER